MRSTGRRRSEAGVGTAVEAAEVVVWTVPVSLPRGPAARDSPSTLGLWGHHAHYGTLVMDMKEIFV